MLVYGISMVRNEADVVRLNVLHHLSLGIDCLLMIDNGSTDGTDRVLQELGSRDPRVRWTRDPGPFKQSEIMTDLAREAEREGADWVLQIDADEFWCAPGDDFRKVLASSEAVVIRAEVVNFIQRRSQVESSPDALLHMTRRAASLVGPPGHAQDLVESRQIAFVEAASPRKCISRPTPEIVIETGNHKVGGVEGPRERTGAVFCLHAPIRSRASLEERLRTAHRPTEAGRKPGQGRYRRWLGQLDRETAVEQEWAANSYRDGFLDVYGERHPVVFDPRLRDAVAPLISRPLLKRISGSLGRLGRRRG